MNKQRWIYPLFAGIGLLLLVVQTTSDRSWVAFGQHFALVYAQRHPEYPVDNTWTEYLTITADVFGADVHSMRGAILSNPGAVLANAWWSIRHLPGVFIQSFWPDQLPVWGDVIWLVELLAVTGLLFRAAVRGIHKPERVEFWAVAGMLVGVAVMSMLLTAPRDIYMLAVQPVALVGIAGLLRP